MIRFYVFALCVLGIIVFACVQSVRAEGCEYHFSARDLIELGHPYGVEIVALSEKRRKEVEALANDENFPEELRFRAKNLLDYADKLLEKR